MNFKKNELTLQIHSRDKLVSEILKDTLPNKPYMKYILNRLLFGGRNGQLPYWIRSYFMYIIPVFYRNKRLQLKLKKITSRPDFEYMCKRADYYCLLRTQRILPKEAFTLGDYVLKKSERLGRQKYFPNESSAKAYFFDSYVTMRWFPRTFRWMHHFGDVIDIKPFPTITKTRPLACDASNNIILKLDRNRHFTFVRDNISTCDKQPRLLCRCSINNRPQRLMLFRKYFGQPWCDIAEVTPNDIVNPLEWQGNKMTLQQHLAFRYIACFEGNDVASNLKWVMSSNSLAVMCRPTCESWFMEGLLIPNYHYILVKDDLSDLKDRLDYYTSHPKEAEAIVQHAHEYVAQFLDETREDLIQLMVAQRYFHYTGQAATLLHSTNL